MPRDEAAAQAAFSRASAQAAESAAARKEEERQKHVAAVAAWEEGRELAALTASSNAVIEMVRAGKLDEAGTAARDLLVRFPDVHDGYDRLGMVYEARHHWRPDMAGTEALKTLEAVARSVNWCTEPQQVLADRRQFVCEVMAHGTLEDILAVRAHHPWEDFRQAYLAASPPAGMGLLGADAPE